MSTAIFYASSTGNTENIAQELSQQLDNIPTFDISQKGIDEISNYEKVILGVSTWGEGELQDDWDDLWEEFCKLDFSGKTVALFGLGDQENYADEFVDALGILYEQVNQAGGHIIGFTSVEGYDHDESKAQIDDSFVGLVIDEDNQDDLSQERVEKWIQAIKSEIW